MIKSGRSTERRRWLGFALILCQSAFLVLTVFPAVVLCHRPDRPAVVEIGFPGGCTCRKCEHCREHHAHPEADRSGTPAATTGHGRHERLLSDAGQDGVVPERRAQDPPPSVCDVAARPTVPEAMTPARTRLPACLSPPPAADPCAPTFLRC